MIDKKKLYETEHYLLPCLFHPKCMNFISEWERKGINRTILGFLFLYTYIYIHTHFCIAMCVHAHVHTHTAEHYLNNIIIIPGGSEHLNSQRIR